MGLFKLRISAQGDQFKLSWEIPGEDGPWEPPAYQVDAGYLQQLSDAVRDQLRELAFFNASDFPAVLQRLAHRGRDLFGLLMPDPDRGDFIGVRSRLEEVAQEPHRNRHEFKITLDTDKLFVPWGFVFAGQTDEVPRKPTMSLADMRGFWLSSFNISVTYFGDPTPLRCERRTSACKFLALHEEMFDGARSSLKEDTEFIKRLDQLLATEMPPTTNWTSFWEQWARAGSAKDSVLYFYGHSDGQRIELREKRDERSRDDPAFDLLAANLKRFRKRPDGSASIFLLNGCQTAAPSGSIEVPISANFLKETRQAGYFGFIGTEAQVSNVFACRYGTEFLWRLFQQGLSVGEAFDELLQDDKLFPQNLLYSCYADRKFRVTTTSNSGKRS
jgi:hypothetical protein